MTLPNAEAAKCRWPCHGRALTAWRLRSCHGHSIRPRRASLWPGHRKSSSTFGLTVPTHVADGEIAFDDRLGGEVDGAVVKGHSPPARRCRNRLPRFAQAGGDSAHLAMATPQMSEQAAGGGLISLGSGSGVIEATFAVSTSVVHQDSGQDRRAAAAAASAVSATGAVPIASRRSTSSVPGHRGLRCAVTGLRYSRGPGAAIGVSANSASRAASQ